MQRPGRVVYARAEEFVAVGRVEAVALDEEEVERAGLGLGLARALDPRRLKFCRRAVGVVARGRVAGRVALPLPLDARAEVWEAEEGARAHDGRGAVGVEREEPDAGDAAEVDVGAHV